jgi:hypothetical protein
MAKKLKDVQALPEPQTQDLLETESESVNERLRKI